MTGAELLADSLAGYGVTHVFMVPAVLRRTLAEMERRTDIRRVQTHGEKSAAYMADGYARATGRPGVCMAQVVGAANLAAGLRDAFLARSPVLAFTGGRLPETKFRAVYQEVDDLPAFEPYTKWNATIDDVARFPDMVRQAFRVATTGSPGPVHLQFQGNEGQIDRRAAEMTPAIDEIFGRVPPFRPEPDAGAVEAVSRALAAAEQPVIVAGGGVAHSGARSELVAFAEQGLIPVATSLNGKDCIPGDHPLSVGVVGTYSRKSANRVVGAADLVFFVGSNAGGMTTHFWRIPAPGTRVLQLDLDPEAIGRHYPASAAMCCDARAGLRALLEAGLDERDGGWSSRAGQIAAEWGRELAPLLESDATPIRPERIVRELTRLAPDDAILLADTGHAGMWMGGFFDVRGTRQRYLRSAGHLGWAYSAGLGAKCGCPDRPVIVFTGDGGMWYHLAEIETAVRCGIDTVTIVNNNSAGNQSKRGFDIAFDGAQTERARELWTFTQQNFATIAQSMGALGIRVERPGDLEGAIARALEAKRPAVIDVVTDIEAMAPLAHVGD